MSLRLSPPAHPDSPAASSDAPKSQSQGSSPVMDAAKHKAWMDALLQERTLYQAWRSSLCIRRSRSNLIVPAIVCVLLSAFVYAKFPASGVTTEVVRITADIASSLRGWADLGLGFSPSVLGFLIAGFTIFATLGKPTLFAKMAVKTDPEAKGQSYLKAGFLRLLRVFAEYWVFTLYCLFIKLFFYQEGPASVLCAALPPTSKYMVFAALFVLTGSLFTYVLMTLQSFIFNIHHLVMMGVRWDAEGWANTVAGGKPNQP